jgi:quinol monooxygenase YgiN
VAIVGHLSVRRCVSFDIYVDADGLATIMLIQEWESRSH